MLIKADEGYALFNEKILAIDDDEKLIGVRAPDLKKIIGSEKDSDLTDFELGKYFEIDILYLMISLMRLASLKERIDFVFKEEKLFNSWAKVDGVSGYLIEKDKNKIVEECRRLKTSENPYLRRMAYILLMNNLNILDSKDIVGEIVPDDHYFVMMGEARLLSYLYLKDEEAVKTLLFDVSLPLKMRLKTISKLIDSYRVSAEEKESLKKIREKIKSATVFAKK